MTSVDMDAETLKLSWAFKLVLPLWKQFGNIY